MMLMTANSNEDSQGTQLRVSKKLTTVCSGKRSRFSKPRPNLSISKRGESNVSAAADKANVNVLKEDIKCETSKADTDVKILKEDIKIETPEADSDVLIQKKDIKTETSKEDSEVKILNEEIKIKAPETDSNVKVLNGDIQIDTSNTDSDVTVLNEDIKIEASEPDPDIKLLKELIEFGASKTDTGKKSLEKEEVLSKKHDNENVLVDDSEIAPLKKKKSLLSKKSVEKDEVLSKEHDKNHVSEKDSQDISSTIPVTLDSEDNTVSTDSNTEKLSPDEDTQVISNIDVHNTSEESIIHTSPAKNLGSRSKVPESDKRGASSITPTVIDKSKYPHLTSILSKKRTEPRKEVQQKRRRKFKKGDVPPERSKMTMADLIYWNPAKTDESHKSAATPNETTSVNTFVEEEEENVDDAIESENNIIDSVPKLVISEDGQINIDQSSLIVSRNIPQPISTEIVRKDDTTYSSFRKRPLTKHWTAKDTANFYRALSLVGADFSLMEQIFPNRTRRELKQKFKREEKFNIDLINKVLYESQTFDEITLNDFLDQNSVDDPVPVNEKEDTVKEKSRKQRTSKKAKSTDNELYDSLIDVTIGETENEKTHNKKGKKKTTKKLSDDDDDEIVIDCELNTSVNDAADKHLEKRKRNAKKLPDDFVDIDSIEDFELLEAMVDDPAILDASEEINSLENQENDNNAEIENIEEEIPSENAFTIFNRIMNGVESNDVQQTVKEETCPETLPLSMTKNDEDYTSVEYIQNNEEDADVHLLGEVVAYEVVNTQTPPPKKRRKINSISPVKAREHLLPTKISPISYTNYTPV